VVIYWTAPSDQGSPITGYKVYIETSTTGVYTIDLDNCNGSDATIITNTECTIPLSELIASIYNLDWGSEINAKVIAFNLYGDSTESDVGNGAIILTNPDAPVNLIEVYAERSATSLGLSWDEGVENGGSPVIDYTVNYEIGTSGSYVELKAGVLLTEYIATGLTPGETYSFKIQARNE
jgi:hypothetical protein